MEYADNNNKKEYHHSYPYKIQKGENKPIWSHEGRLMSFASVTQLSLSLPCINKIGNSQLTFVMAGLPAGIVRSNSAPSLGV